MSSIRIGDIDIHYELADYTDPWASSDTVLLHHGFARNMEFWRPWVPLLARDYRVLRFDSRGCGKTSVPAPDEPYTLERMVDDALGLMDALGIERVHWAAEASGGHVGLALALRRPERVQSLTLCNTPFRLPTARRRKRPSRSCANRRKSPLRRRRLPSRRNLIFPKRRLPARC